MSNPYDNRPLESPDELVELGEEDEIIERDAEDELDEEDQPPRRYRSVNALAVLSLTCGVLTIGTFVFWSMVVAPVVGILAGYVALRQIRKAPEERTGVPMAYAGLALSAVVWIAGYSWLIHGYFAAAPPGYQLVRYEMLQPDPEVEGERVPPEAIELDGQKIYIEGYMYPGRQTRGLARFALNPYNEKCQYCQVDPKPTELIRVKLVGGLRTDYTQQVRGVGGKFHVEVPELGSGPVVYWLEGDVVR